MKKTYRNWIAGELLVTLLVMGPQVHAQGNLVAQTGIGALDAKASVKFLPFNAFMDNTQRADSNAMMALPSAKVTNAAAFEQMRQHILSMYAGVEVSHSFVLDTQHFDCIPTQQQPAVRLLGIQAIAAPPPVSLLRTQLRPGGASAGTPALVTTQLEGTPQFDRFGNVVGCEAGTIPMRRLTLEEMSQFASLQKFFDKGISVPQSKGANTPPAFYAHKYSFTYQYANNHGGNSNLNLWRPYVNTSLNEVFSLSQEWYIGGSGSATQTAEVGWQNYPAKYGSENSALFIYWTADNYSSTGCYNLDCAAFVQTNNSWHLGGAFNNYSSFGGTQYEFSAEYYLYNGNWWLALGGTWVGYYPGTLYRGGQLTRYSQLTEFGSESVGTTIWPPEGSGLWSADGWSYAAYQRNIFYINTGNAGIWSSLTPDDPSPACYSTSGPYSSTSSGWQVYFYLGGPGGRGC